MKFDVPFWKDQYRGGCHIFLKRFQSFVAFLVPVISSILLQKLFHWSMDLGIAFDELPIVARLSQCGT